jgi:hypothetical protein
LRRARTTGTTGSATRTSGSAAGTAGSGAAKERCSSAGSTTIDVSVIGAAVGSTEKAGDFAEREDRRLDFFGAAASGTSVT